MHITYIANGDSSKQKQKVKNINEKSIIYVIGMNILFSIKVIEIQDITNGKIINNRVFLYLDFNKFILKFTK